MRPPKSRSPFRMKGAMAICTVLFSLMALGTALAYLTSADEVSGEFSPAATPEQQIVAFYCQNDNSLNFAAVESLPSLDGSGNYVIEGKTARQYFDANKPLKDPTGSGAFSAVNRQPDNLTYDSKQPRIGKVCFLNPMSPRSMIGWLADTGRIDVVEGLENLDSSQVERLDWCFCGASGQAMAEIASSLNTAKVTSIEGCFLNSNIAGLDVSGWDTSRMHNMASAFELATGGHLDLSSWDVSAVRTMDRMFHSSFRAYYFMTDGYESTDNQAALNPNWWQLDLSGWNPAALESYTDMFSGCCVEELDLSGMDNRRIPQDPGLASSQARAVTVGKCWSWAHVHCGEAPWRSDATGTGYQWQYGTSPDGRPPDETSARYDRSTLFGVLSDGTMNVYRVINVGSAATSEDVLSMEYQVFQRYNHHSSDGLFPLYHLGSYADSSEVPWNSVAEEVTSVAFKNWAAPFSMDHWFDRFLNCRTFNLEKLDTSACALSRPLFYDSAAMEQVTLGSGWVFPREAWKYAKLQPGTWFDGNADFSENEQLPVPGSYRRLSPQAFITEDGALHLSNGKKGADELAGSLGIIRQWDLGTTWLRDTAPSIPWSESDYSSVVVDTPLAPTSCRGWFARSRAAKMDLTSLDTRRCVSMEGMFAECDKLADVALGENFSFCGSGESPLCQLPEGEWQDYCTGQAFAASDIPDGKAARYTKGIGWQALLVEKPSGAFQLRFQMAAPATAGDEVPSAGTMQQVFSGFVRDEYASQKEVPWHSWRSQIDEVVLVDQLKPLSTSYWFTGFSACSALDLTNLDTTAALSMNDMFSNCSAKTITVGNRFSFEGATSARLCSFPPGTWKATGSGEVYDNPSSIPSCTAETYRSGLVPQALYLSTKELRFIYDDLYQEDAFGAYPAYDGAAVLAVWRMDKTYGTAPWQSTTGYGNLNVPGNALRVAADDPVKCASIAGWFSGFSNCIEMDLEKMDVSECTSLANTFSGCRALARLSIDSWKPKNLLSLSSAFNGCSQLPRLNLEGWGVSNLTAMDNAFRSMANLAELRISSWKPEKCTNFSSAFNGLSNLESLDVSHWQCTSAQNLAYMFANCRKLEHLDLGSFCPTAATNLIRTFQGCSNLKTLDISALRVTGKADLYYTFENCSNLAIIYGQNWDTANCIDCDYTFKGCGALTGQNGTTISSLGHANASSARIDGPSTPGLFTAKTLASVE